MKGTHDSAPAKFKPKAWNQFGFKNDRAKIINDVVVCKLCFCELRCMGNIMNVEMHMKAITKYTSPDNGKLDQNKIIQPSMFDSYHL